MKLNATQARILQLIADGYNHIEIAEKLKTKQETIYCRIRWARISNKMNSTNQLIAEAMRHKLIN